MCNQLRWGKIERVQLILLPPLIFVAGIVVYNVFLMISPPAMTVTKTERVEALQVIDRINPNRKNGLPLAQAEPLRGGGGSRIAVTHPATGGAFVLVQGHLLHDFLYEKSPPDSMLHISVSKQAFRVESEGQPVDAFILLPRSEANPLKIDGIPLGADEEIISRLFIEPTILPAPQGKLTGGKFESKNGMVVETSIGAGGGGLLSLGGMISLNIDIDSGSRAWVEAARNTRVQHMAMGAENLDIGILIPHEGDPTKVFQIFLFDELVATISLPTTGG